jgi:hypothetical protein
VSHATHLPAAQALVTGTVYKALVQALVCTPEQHACACAGALASQQAPCSTA